MRQERKQLKFQTCDGHKGALDLVVNFIGE